ncbi:MAG: hypothetical protein JNL88_07750 [Bacteroidia bacterium]|nr:hypothetical protein [Bacteroidia bacterium]
MNTKVIIAGLVAGLTGFLLGWVVYGMLLMDFMTAHCTNYPGLMKEPPVLWAIFFANCCSGWLFAYIFHRIGGIQSFAGGFQTGLIISLLFTLNLDLYYYSMMNMGDSTYYAVDVVVSTLMGAVMAGVAGAMLGTGKKAA